MTSKKIMNMCDIIEAELKDIRAEFRRDGLTESVVSRLLDLNFEGIQDLLNNWHKIHLSIFTRKKVKDRVLNILDNVNYHTGVMLESDFIIKTNKEENES